MSCCPDPLKYYVGGQWICENCKKGKEDTKFDDYKEWSYGTGVNFAPKADKKCTCGAEKTYGKDSNLHAFHCEKA